MFANFRAAYMYTNSSIDILDENNYSNTVSYTPLINIIHI